MTIPKITHQTWMQGWNNLPEKFQENVEGLHELNPEYKHMRWDEESLRQECLKYSRACMNKYNSFEYMHSKVDFGRYVVLYNYGGISVDTDMVSLRPIRDTPGLEDSEFFISELSYPGNLVGLKNNAVILCVAKHPIMKECIDLIIKDVRLPSDFKLKEEYVNETTGPIFIGRLVAKYKDAVKTMDYTYYEPCSPKDPYCEIPDKAIMDHQHELSWTSNTYQFLIWLMYFILHYFWIMLFVAVGAGYLFYRYFHKSKPSKISK